MTAPPKPLKPPFTEDAEQPREYYPVRTIMSSDGIFAVQIKPLKKLHTRDMNLTKVDLILLNPDPTV